MGVRNRTIENTRGVERQEPKVESGTVSPPHLVTPSPCQVVPNAQHLTPNASSALSRSFYDRETTEVARDLLGRLLVHHTPEGVLAGIIVETEAYCASDPASHSYRGQNRRNVSMFGRPGTLYIYKIYGVHWCMNAVTGAEGIGEAVLIRALEPVTGIEVMQRNRGVEEIKRLCKGPGCVCSAMGLSGNDDGSDLTQGSIIISGEPNPTQEIVVTTRIGITKAAEYPWRYYLKNNPYVSRR